jgi:hypothetical protein
MFGQIAVGVLGGGQDSLFSGLDFSSGGLGQMNDLWGSFTGTSASTFMEAGLKTVSQAEQKLKSNLSSNPSGALTEFSRFLNDSRAKYKNALSNSSQSKTRDGNRKSMNDVQSAINKIPQFINKLEKTYSVSKTSKQASRTDFGKYTTDYTYYVYEVTKKSVNASGIDYSSTSNGVPTQPIKSSMGYFAIGLMAWLLFSKKANKQAKKQMKRLSKF